MKPIMGDLFCGRGGWTKGFQAHGWDCWGVDLNPQPLYPGRFIQADIAQLVELPYADFYCCSSPCQGYSVHGMKHFHKNPPWPFWSEALFSYASYLLEQTRKPYIMENVRAAQYFRGKSVHHCGPFHFWGTAVPAIFPRDAYRVIKKTCEEKRRLIEHSAKAAEIPHEIAHYIAQTACSIGVNFEA